MDRELDREIKRLTRRIKKNNNLRKQCRSSAEMIEIEGDGLGSSATRAAELRGTAAALGEENDVLAYKLKLRSRLRDRVNFMKKAADATWRACGGRGRTRELALALAKITALQEECAELQNGHLEALQEGMRSKVSTTEIAQELSTTKAILERERLQMIAKDEEIGRLQDENAKLEAHINAMEKNMARSSNEIAALRDEARKSRASEIVLRQSVSEQKIKTAKLEQSLASAKIEAEHSRDREARLRVHVAATSPRTYAYPPAVGLLAGSLYGDVNSNIDALYGNPYLSDTAKKLAFDSVACFATMRCDNSLRLHA